MINKIITTILSIKSQSLNSNKRNKGAIQTASIGTVHKKPKDENLKRYHELQEVKREINEYQCYIEILKSDNPDIKLDYLLGQLDKLYQYKQELEQKIRDDISKKSDCKENITGSVK